MKKVALFTTFFEVESGYSLVGVAETQIRSLLDHNYEPRVLVQDNFQFPEPPSIWRQEVTDIQPVIPFMHLDQGVHDDFEERVKQIEVALEEALEGYEVCITHDIILQNFYKEHNQAMRNVAKRRPDLLWLHWIHSCPVRDRNLTYPHSLRFTPPPGYVVYPNDTDKGIVSAAYGLEGREWKVRANRSGHAINPLALWPYDKLTINLAHEADLFSGEVTAVYPARLDRGKQPEKIIRLMAGVQNAGYEPRLMVIDWQSAGKRFQDYIDELLVLSKSLGLEGKVNFTSRLDDRCSQGVPRKVVIELMDLTNVYIHPSRVETYSLTTHEAMLRGNLCCLNYDFPAMRELFADGALYFDFGSDRNDRTYNPDEQSFWNDDAKRLIAELKTNRALMARTRAMREWNPDALFKEFEPLLYLGPVRE
jgi:glycosyltransferase involved in cell wall biosynthesis